MAFDGLVTYTISKELQGKIIGGKIDKVFQPNNSEILLGIYYNGIKYALNIVVSSNNYRACLTTHQKPNPKFAPNFCMVLRKYLVGTKITKLYTLSLERIIIIEFEGYNKSGDFGTKKLILELMGKHSNIILLDSNDTIIDSLKHFDQNSNSYRCIFPNYTYTLPTSNKLDFMQINDNNEFYSTITKNSSDNKISNMISNTFTGISKTSITYIIDKLDIDDTNLCKENFDRIYNYIKNLLNNAIIVQYKNNYSISLPESTNSESLQANFFIDDFYTQKEDSEIFITYRENLSKLILNYMKKLNSKLYNINSKLKECNDMELYKLYGELITSNLYKINDSHLSEITVENYYDNNNLITIPLDKSLLPSINAKKYFKKYHKLKNAKIIVEEQKHDVEKEINYLESIIYEFQSASTSADINNIYHEFSENILDNTKSSKQNNNSKKVKKIDKNTIAQVGTPIKCKIDGFTVIIGKNNKQNDYITKQANPEDIWFHTKDIHGSHVILKTDNKVPSQDTINRCASIAAFYSKARQSNNVPVDYTYIKYVKKPSKFKPGMVIYTNNKNVIVKPLNFE